jgi:hypothetical protein
MTIQNISRLAALVAKYFHETPRFDYRIFREKQAEGNSYPLGSFVLILRRQDLGLANLPEIFPVPDGYQLRLGRRVIAEADKPEKFGCAYSHWSERKSEYSIFTPSGECFDTVELLARQRNFLTEAVESGFQVSPRSRQLLQSGRRIHHAAKTETPPLGIFGNSPESKEAA